MYVYIYTSILQRVDGNFGAKKTIKTCICKSLIVRICSKNESKFDHYNALILVLLFDDFHQSWNLAKSF